MSEVKENAKATLELCKLSEKELLAMIVVELMHINKHVRDAKLDISVIKMQLKR